MVISICLYAIYNSDGFAIWVSSKQLIFGRLFFYFENEAELEKKIHFKSIDIKRTCLWIIVSSDDVGFSAPRD